VQPCELYGSIKSPKQQLFVAAAALAYLTGDNGYRADADSKWLEPYAFTFFYNWNNVWPQGIAALASAPDMPGAARTKGFYMSLLRSGVKYYSECSNTGRSGTFCRYVSLLHLPLAECALFAAR
jgi:hypothetical protein